jgi:hypothetical protein
LNCRRTPKKRRIAYQKRLLNISARRNHWRRLDSTLIAWRNPAVDSVVRRVGLSSVEISGASANSITSPAPASSKHVIGAGAYLSSVFDVVVAEDRLAAARRQHEIGAEC